MTNIEKIQKKLDDVDAVIITSPYNRRYFTDFKSSAGISLITKKNSYFLVDFRYIEKAKATIKTSQCILLTKRKDQLDEIFQKENIKRIGFEDDFVTVAALNMLKEEFPQVEFVPFSEFILHQRTIKSHQELEKIKKAQAITDKGFSYIINFIKPGMTEKEISLELEYYMKKNGADALAFDNIVVSGKNSSLPHGVPGDKKVETGDFITMDFGAMYDGYCSDMTRTVALGKVTEEMREVYNTVLKAQKACLEKIKAGVTGFEIDKIARDIIYENYEGCFGHGLGHSVGLEIHEMPAFNTVYKGKIEEGTIMTVEPGIYIENKFGVRIEDMVYITKEGCINLTSSPKDLIIL